MITKKTMAEIRDEEALLWTDAFYPDSKMWASKDGNAFAGFKAGFDCRDKLDNEVLKIAIEALEYYANHESVIKEAFHTGVGSQIQVVHTFISHAAKTALKKIEEMK